MFCNKCGYEMQDGTPRCPVCGAEFGYVPQDNIQVQNGEIAEETRTYIVGTILGIVSAVLLLVGTLVPAIDFRSFNEGVDLQYNLLKICKNVALISDIWRAIPIGFYIAAGFMLILSFVKIPILRILPCILAIAMFVIILVDVGNVIDWVMDLLSRFIDIKEVTVDIAQIIKSLMAGVYLLVAGVITGLISAFIKK